jgi:fibrillarin-like rRNA methylase
VVLGERDYGELERLAQENGTTVSDLVREVMKVGVWYMREVKAHPGRKLLLQKDKRESPTELLVIG